MQIDRGERKIAPAIPYLGTRWKSLGGGALVLLKEVLSEHPPLHWLRKFKEL
jgi:hypothetical protein